MSKFNLSPLSFALLGAMTTSAFADTTTSENTNTHQLATIVVSASGFEQDIKNAPASISVVTKEDIEKKNATSIADLLSDVPGIDIRDGIGKTSGLNIKMRGLGNEYSLILIDGRRQTTSSDVTPNGFGESANGFLPPLASIERIEVIRGPMATRYGSEAMGGVINIITKKISNEWNGNVTVSGNVMEHGGEADSWKTSVVVNGPIIQDKLGLQLRGSYLDRQKSERVPGTSGRDPRPSEADIYDVGGKLSFKLNDQNSFWIDGFHSSQTYKNDDNRLGTLDTPERANGYKDELEFKRDQIAVGHNGDYSFGQWNSYVSQTKTETIGRTIPRNTFPGNASAGQNRTLKNTDFVADSHVILPIADHKLTVGAEYKEAEIADDIAGLGATFKKDSFSVYAEDEWRILDKLGFTFGGRYEDHSGFGGQFSPRAYLVWNANDELTFKGGVSTGYKAPSAKDLHNGVISVGNQGGTFNVGSPNLKPEESTNYELGFNYNNGNLDLTTTAFFNKIKNLITEGPELLNCFSATNPNQLGCVSYGSHITQDTFSQKINADEAETKGVELSLKYSIIPEWDIKAAYTYMESEITKGKNKGSYLSNVPKNAFNMTSTFHINDAFDVWLQHEYKSDRKRYNTEQTAGDAAIIYNATNNKLKGYNLFNLGASYSVNDQLRFNGSVNNLLDKDFSSNGSYIDANGNPASYYDYMQISSGMSGTYLAGRNYWLSVSYDF
ncbi:outer membrane receptor for ferrienterochelin and colicins [Acinetobacter sp. BIGb0102]|uniref:TonB-dependent receptor domain-containing protein n=1 Tax=Acinetobacter sp. BIGb0102 TaxID=2485131 RepID=UPI000F4F1976|nr:TonB-dependent receptor [Acinetobacter sp. BIGb0102]RPE29717.1 outer membrane receptor for ferrienterochelin and colicins [Acinetobacter sp. BIGb0102]